MMRSYERLAVALGPQIRRAGIMVLVFIAACSANAPNASLPDPHTTSHGWTLAWSDEFNGKAGDPVDSTIWSYDIGDGCAAGICGWGNAEKETYTRAADNVSQNGQGHLVIVARPA